MYLRNSLAGINAVSITVALLDFNVLPPSHIRKSLTSIEFTHTDGIQLAVRIGFKHGSIPREMIYAMLTSALCNRTHGTLTVPHAIPHAHASPTEIRHNDFCNCAHYIILFLYFLIDEALLFLASAVFAFSSLTRVCRILAYSVYVFCQSL